MPVNLIQLMVVFNLGYFGGGLFLIHIQMEIKSGLMCRTVRSNRRYIGECLWIWPHPYECVHTFALVRVGTPIWCLYNRRFVSVAFSARALGFHLPRWKMSDMFPLI